jgi:hypothetical protein
VRVQSVAVTSERPSRAASVAAVRRRGAHALAPEHLGEATAAATLAVMVGGVALVITGIGIIAQALTLGVRFGGDPPPDIGSYAVGPLIFGVGAVLLGGGLTAGGLAVINDARGARRITGVLSALAAALSAGLTVAVMVNPPPDTVLAIALTISTLVFGVAAILLLRPRR